MKPIEIANRFREVILNGTWVANTNFKAQLEATDWQLVTTQLDDLNTIAALAQHIHYYICGLNQVFKGGTLDIKDKYSFDFPPVNCQKDWDAFLSRFWKDAETFAVLVAEMSEAQLKGPFIEEKYGSYERNIEAMIEHSYYHLGQITLLKKRLTPQ
jgi:hypothetical protein